MVSIEGDSLMKYFALPILTMLAGAVSPSPELVASIETDKPGEATVCLWTNKDGFPNCQKGKPFRQQKVTLNRGRTVLRFDNVPDGRYAISVALDANGNGKIDTNFLGIPREPFGVSGKRPGFGKPAFADAVFSHPGLPSTIRLSE